METVQQNGCFTLFSIKFHSNVYSILFCVFFFRNNSRKLIKEKSSQFAGLSSSRRRERFSYSSKAFSKYNSLGTQRCPG